MTLWKGSFIEFICIQKGTWLAYSHLYYSVLTIIDTILATVIYHYYAVDNFIFFLHFHDKQFC